MSRHEVGTEEKSRKGFVELLGCLYRSVTSQTSDGEEARFRSEGDRGSYSGTGAGESKIKLRKDRRWRNKRANHVLSSLGIRSWF